MEVIIFIGLVAVGLVIFYNWNKKDVPADVVKTEQDDSAKESITVVPLVTDVPPAVLVVTNTSAPAEEPAKKPAAKKPAAKKTAAKKTAGAKKPASKKKSA